MEFKFRAGDHRPPPPPPLLPKFASPRPPPAFYYFAKQGFPDPCLRQNTTTIRKPLDINAMHCEIELMRLREEKLLVEIERQRFLKEEARRKLILAEREMAIRGVAQSQRWGTPFNALTPAPESSSAAVVQSFHEWQQMEQLKSSNDRSFGAVTLAPRLQPFMADDDKKLRHVQADKSELIVLEKPGPKLFSEKRKAETPLAMDVNDIKSLGVKKNGKDEWSCALCQVTVTNENTFNKHLQGKKHKRKEAGLRAQKASNVSWAAPGPISNKRRKLLEVTETVSYAGAEKKVLKVGESLQCEKTGGIFNLNTIKPDFLNVGGKEDHKQQNEAVMEQNLISEDIFVAKKKFKFWCKMCKVGAHTTEVMFAHLNGKKHKASFQVVGQSGTGQPM